MNAFFSRPAVASLSFAIALGAAGCTSLPATSPVPRPPASAPSNDAWDIANLPHERVDFWVDRFTTGDKREEIAGYLARKPEYESMILGKLRQRGMPLDLIYLAMIESGFNPEARSAWGAAGMWQLVPDTARRHGLRVDDEMDERLDPEKATDAALAYLAKLHDHFDSWYLAAAAYNVGENRVARIMVEQTGNDRGTDADFYRIRELLPPETQDFVPAMVAAARIGKDPARYGFGG